MMHRICVQWPRFGPYHLARLRAVQAFLSSREVELVALETCRDDALYAWDVVERDEPFQRVRLITDRLYEDVPPATLFDAMVATLDRLQPDGLAVTSYSTADAQGALWWARRHRRPIVFMTDTKADDAQRAAWREALKRRLVQQFDAAFISGTPHRAYFASLGLPDAAIVTGCSVVDNAFFQERAAYVSRLPHDAALPGLADPTPFFLSSSRFLPRKNLDGLLHAYHRYRRHAPHPWRLVLLGDGALRPELEALIEHLALDGVTLAGFRQLHEIVVYYGRASAFIHPAHVEPWGLVVNEAMAAGLPVLVSETAGCATDLVYPGLNGYRFAPTNTEQLAQFMARLADPATDRAAMGKHSQTIIARYTPEHFARQLWAALQAARARCNRSLDPVVRLMLWVLRQPRRLDTFHSATEP